MTKDNNDNINISTTNNKTNKIENLISNYKRDILQRYFRKESGKKLLYSIITICLGRGLIGKLLFHETFLYAFSYPLIIIGTVSVIYISLKLISFKSIKIAQILEKTLFIISCTFLTLIFLLLIILILNKFLHFWF